MTALYIHHQNSQQFFDLPTQWRLLTFAALPDRSGPEDVAARTKEVMKSPVGHASLANSIATSDKVAILIEDPSRASPKKLVLRALLEDLADANVPKDQIVIVIALATHRQLSMEEMGRVYGEDLVEQYLFVNHDCKALDQVPIATLKSGTPVKINRRVYEADFKIGIGSIFPHPLNGFGGGCKILFPGVADFDAILEHHLKYFLRGGYQTGKMEGNVFYDEVCALSKAGGLNFIINSVLDHKDQLYDLVCGDPVEAHRAGTEICRSILAMEFSKKADVTIVSTFPYSEGPQIMKPLGLATQLTEDGGLIILMADCTVPLPEEYLVSCESFRKRYPGRLKEAVFEHFRNNKRIMETGPPELNMSLAEAMLAQDHMKIILVSKDISRKTAEQLGFMYAEDLDQALTMGQKIFPSAEVHVVPSGGVILPVFHTVCRD